MFEHIVVGTDGSDRASTAVEQAAMLASVHDAELHLVMGCGNPLVLAPMFGAVEPVAAGDLVAACEEQLAPLADELRGRGIAVKVHVSPTDGVTALCSTAEAIGADLIVVGNRGMTGARRLLGSVPNSVAHQASCTVMIVQTD